MSEVNLKIDIPLDEDKYLRRECNLCKKEFKIKLSEMELNQQIALLSQDYLEKTDKANSDLQDYNKHPEYFCPYCGQPSVMSTYWTQRQIEFIKKHLQNYVNYIINREFVEKMQHMSTGLVTFKGSKMPIIEPFMLPEENDMVVFHLKCCDEYVKIDSTSGVVYCFYCGFKHAFV